MVNSFLSAEAILDILCSRIFHNLSQLLEVTGIGIIVLVLLHVTVEDSVNSGVSYWPNDNVIIVLGVDVLLPIAVTEDEQRPVSSTLSELQIRTSAEHFSG